MNNNNKPFSQTNATPLSLFHPRYWGVWLAIGLLRLLTLLPWAWQMRVGQFIGQSMYHILSSRRHVATVNLKLAFPDASEKERKQLCIDHFISLGQGIMDMSLSWWGSDEKLASLSSIEGLEHLHYGLAQDQGVILFGMHFTSLEIGGPIVSKLTNGVHVVYRPHKNPLLEHLVANVRARRYGKAIPKTKIRELITSLKKGHIVWTAPDQSFQYKNSLQIPFFGVKAPTNPSTSRLASIGNALVIPFITVRQYDEKKRVTGYLLRFLPPLRDFPSDDAEQDTIRTNLLIEQQVREFPAHYLWTHKRYKHSKASGIDHYAKHNTT
ncbi:MAG: lipid A biosynthesis lauroyl acyltransferase [Cocleimonas sp.]|nr:lipid A biosynthesis lauroyl acyltransferase [Cocleimonas sp.]